MARRKKKSSLKKLLCIVFIFLISGISAYLYVTFSDIESLKKQNPKKTSFMEHREKEWKNQRKKYTIQQRWVPLSHISPYLVKAVLIAEDDKFWSHEGFDYEAMQKAIEKDIKAKKFKLGGSTISQQLAKNLYLSPSKNPLRKIAEAVITWKMERALSKKRILELYLNVAEWSGGGIFGIEAAARHYYGKSASDLTPEESARLASVLPNPRKFNPSGDSRYVTYRSNLIYSIMVKRGIVVPEYEEVIEEDKSDSSRSEIKGPPETASPAAQ
ncbi:MAG: monofunctional biosynthetic peptidoglycan transglycosylase [Nitrospirae bacterium]|nr:MAG: monofunctional biosynthetic peptidoglycan transglycosylase [Nitrospirota bacterium]